MKISVVVTNWNGKTILEKSLPQIIKYSKIASEIIIVDDFSEDDSLAFIKSEQKKNKKIVLVPQTENRGFANTSNLGVQVAKGELIVLLNNDIYPTDGYIENSLHHFKDPKVFGVGFAEVGSENWPRIFWSEGYFQYEPIHSNSVHIAAWLSGGSCIVRKKIFQSLGGFDEVYKPFYSEDLDLGYRAWKSGYTLLWEPESKVYHRHGTTTSKFSKHFTDYVKERNRLLVVYRNITDKSLLRSNYVGIIFRILFGPNYIKIVRAAKRQISSYPKSIYVNSRTDREIFNMFSKDETKD